MAPWQEVILDPGRHSGIITSAAQPASANLTLWILLRSTRTLCGYDGNSSLAGSLTLGYSIQFKVQSNIIAYVASSDGGN